MLLLCPFYGSPLFMVVVAAAVSMGKNRGEEGQKEEGQQETRGKEGQKEEGGIHTHTYIHIYIYILQSM